MILYNAHENFNIITVEELESFGDGRIIINLIIYLEV
jgi:hypothetical protein